MKTLPTAYLSKRENGTYCIIFNGLPLNQYTDKDTCILQAARLKLPESLPVWDCLTGTFITE